MKLAIFTLLMLFLYFTTFHDTAYLLLTDLKVFVVHVVWQVQILSQAWGYRSEDQFLHCLPLHHIHKKLMLNAILST